MHLLADLAIRNNSILFSLDDFNCEQPVDSMCKEYDGCVYCEKRKKEHEKLDKVYLKTLENKTMWCWNKQLDSNLV